jgi:hypothetical protein
MSLLHTPGVRFCGKLLVIKEPCPVILRWALCMFILAFGLGPARANPQLSLDNPTAFFTTVSSNLLAEQLDVNLSHIRIYPTNEYTPAVHRLCQMTANIYDATTTNFYPTVFRPYFTTDGTNVFISGYEQVDTNSTAFAQHPIEIADAFADGVIGTNTHLNFYNIPWILGAKKGLPNFNEVSMENIVGITRRLFCVKQAPEPDLSLQITPMYELGISNLLGVEFWNSYPSNYPGTILINIDCSVTATLTNDQGLSYSNGFTFTSSLQTNQWHGYNMNFPKSSIIVSTNLQIVLPDSVYRQNPPHFESAPAAFDTNADFSIPDWKFNIQSKVFCQMFDVGPPLRLIDYVQFDGPNSSRDLMSEIQTPDDASGYNGFWSTNLVSTAFGTMPLGMANQIYVSLGLLPLPPNSNPSLQMAILGFRHWIFDDFTPIGATNQTPVMPLSQTAQLFTWEVNDPLVHYLSSDLIRAPFTAKPPFSSFNLYSLGFVNHSYSPWGSMLSSPPFTFEPAVKDPSVRSSADWNFPTGQSLSFDWLGRVHRGTPWQTIYLKSPIASLAEWESYSGITNPVQAALTHPTNDWPIAALWARWLNTNELTSLFSINSGSEAWAARLEGLVVLTNSSTTQYDPLFISSNSPQAGTIAAGIQTARTSMPGQFFRTVDDVLATPELSLTSPWLNHAYDQTPLGISDEAYEKIATQLLPLLRSDSVGSAMVHNGQSVVTFSGYDSHEYVIEASPDMNSWVAIQTNSPVNGIMAVTNATSGIQKYFRSVLIH